MEIILNDVDILTMGELGLNYVLVNFRGFCMFAASVVSFQVFTSRV